MGLEIAVAVMIFGTICGMFKLKSVEKENESQVELIKIALSKKTEDKSEDKINIEHQKEKDDLINIINMVRSRYDKLESKYIPLLQENEILRAKQIKNKTLASEIFGDDNE